MVLYGNSTQVICRFTRPTHKNQHKIYIMYKSEEKESAKTRITWSIRTSVAVKSGEYRTGLLNLASTPYIHKESVKEIIKQNTMLTVIAWLNRAELLNTTIFTVISRNHHHSLSSCLWTNDDMRSTFELNFIAFKHSTQIVIKWKIGIIM